MRFAPLALVALGLTGCPTPRTTDTGLDVAEDAHTADPDDASGDRPDAPSLDVGLDAAVDAPTPLDAAPGSDTAMLPDTPRDTPGDASLTARGASLYATHCALCHAADGRGYAADNAPAISSPEYLRIASDAFLEAAIHDGRPGTPMSAWGVDHGGPFTRDDTRAVMAFLRSFATGPVEDLSGIIVTGSATAGAPLYAEHCASCHGARGEGGTAPTLDNPVFHATASDGFLRRSVADGRPRTPMMAYAGTLAPVEIDNVVAFVKTLRRTADPMWPIEDVPTSGNFILNPAGSAPTFTLRDGRYVPAAEVDAAMRAGRRIILVDARATSDWVLGHIPGAVPVPFYSVESLAMTLPNDGTWIVAYCACPHAASGRVVDQLRTLGFANTAVLDEGILVWRDRGYPMARGRLPMP